MLKFIDLSYSASLIRTPDFSGAPRLEGLNLNGCTNLVEIHPSIGQLSRLRYLHLQHCRSLINLPSMSSKMKSLTVLDLFGCLKISSIPKFTGIMESLLELNLGETAIKELAPSSNMDNLRSLEKLILIRCTKLKLLPRLPSNVRYINAQYCHSLKWSPALVKLSSLSQPLFRCRSYDESGSGVAFTILYHYLQGLPFCKIINGTSTKKKEDGPITGLQIIVWGYEIPSWLTYQSVGNSVSIELPSNWCNSKWMGFALCASISGTNHTRSRVRARVIAPGYMPQNQYASELFTIWMHCEGSKSKLCLGRIWLLYLSRDDWFATVGNGECSQIKVIFESYDSAIHVCECGVNLVYKQDVEEFSQQMHNV